MVVLQSLGQARERWGELSATALWEGDRGQGAAAANGLRRVAEGAAVEPTFTDLYCPSLLSSPEVAMMGACQGAPRRVGEMACAGRSQASSMTS